MAAPAVSDSTGLLSQHASMLEPTNDKLQQLLNHAKGVDFTKGMTSGKCPFLALQTGQKVMDDDHSLKVGTRGGVLLEDQFLREKINHFDHERIPERVVHARGTGAHGYFQVYKSQSALTKAALFQDPSVKTPVFVRFSTVLGSRGSPDTVRDIRGFATKFYTPEGNWDLVGNNIPVFFIQDAIKFPDIIHSGKPDQQHEIPQAQTAHDNFWDFISFTPESLHTVAWAMSDRAIPRSYRMMQGFGVHTFALVNEAGVRTFVKFHWRPLLGLHGLAWDECLKINGADPDFHRRDLYEAITSGSFPEYELGFQVVAEADEHKFDFDLLDATKIIPEELVPINWIGKMTLDRTPSDFFAEVEQVAYCTQNIVPGIDFTADPLLQGRNFSYLDTQLSRLGSVNFNQIPINQSLAPVVNNQRDGHMQMNIHTDKINYYPNRYAMEGRTAIPLNGGENQNLKTPADIRRNAFESYAEKMQGMKVRMKDPKFLEFYDQTSLFYNSQTATEQKHMLASTSFELSKVDDLGVRERMVTHWNEMDHEFATALAKNIGVAPPGPPKHKNHGKKSNFLSMIASPYTPGDTIATRKVAIILGDGYRAAELKYVKAALEKEQALVTLIGMRKGLIFAEGSKGASASVAASASSAATSSSGDCADCGFTIFNSKSVLFDSLVLIGGTHIEALKNEGAVAGFIAEQLKHCKAVAACSEAIELLAYPCGLAGIKLANAGQCINDQAVITAGSIADGKLADEFTGNFIAAMKKHRFWERQIQRIPV